MPVMFFPYRFDRRVAPILRTFGVRPELDGVRVESDQLGATFGFLNLTVPLADIDELTVSGPYKWYRALGPRLSAADHGATFGTTTTAGVCLQFSEPIPAIFGPWDHPGLTLTVAEPQALVDYLSPLIAASGR